jgi:poly-beta-hydroxyalkanoate depolymerase
MTIEGGVTIFRRWPTEAAMTCASASRKNCIIYIGVGHYGVFSGHVSAMMSSRRS